MIAIFDCGYDEGRFNRADRIESVLKDNYIKSKTFVVSRNEFPDKSSMEQYKGIIITGSPKTIDDRDEWIGRLKSVIRGQADKPILGICLGHQLLSLIRGGSVEKLAQGRNFGYGEVYLTKEGGNSRLFKGIPSPFLSFFSHRYAIARLQPGAVLLASNGSGVLAFRHGSHYGVQFHPDFSWQIAEHFADKYEMDPRHPGDARLEESWKANRQIIINFAEIALTRDPE